ncbi:MAG: hypothetical protein ACOWWM_11500 [Desulfobacterales bacterium]|jgi:hypothetical protein
MAAIPKIDMFQKILLSLEAGADSKRLDLQPGPVGFSFIFGIGSRGLAPIEYELNGLSPGAERTFPLDALQLHSFFGHLARPVLAVFPALETAGDFTLKIRVQHVSPAGQREIIQAMAVSAGGCGSGGDCGCGCH